MYWLTLSPFFLYFCLTYWKCRLTYGEQKRRLLFRLRSRVKLSIQSSSIGSDYQRCSWFLMSWSFLRSSTHSSLFNVSVFMSLFDTFNILMIAGRLMENQLSHLYAEYWRTVASNCIWSDLLLEACLPTYEEKDKNLDYKKSTFPLNGSGARVKGLDWNHCPMSTLRQCRGSIIL